MLTTLGAYDLQLYLKEHPAQVFTYEFWKFFMNTLFTEHFQNLFSTASDTRRKLRLREDFIFGERRIKV